MNNQEINLDMSFEWCRTMEEFRRVAESMQQFVIVQMLKPRIFVDGDQWCVLYGDNLQEGICGFGDTPISAVIAFNDAWNLKVVMPKSTEKGVKE